MTETTATFVRGCLVTASSNIGIRSGSEAGNRCIRWIRGLCGTLSLEIAVAAAAGVVLAHLESFGVCSAPLCRTNTGIVAL